MMNEESHIISVFSKEFELFLETYPDIGTNVVEMMREMLNKAYTFSYSAHIHSHRFSQAILIMMLDSGREEIKLKFEDVLALQEYKLKYEIDENGDSTFKVIYPGEEK